MKHGSFAAKEMALSLIRQKIKILIKLLCF